MKPMRVLALIPCYNEAGRIGAVVQGCLEHVEAALVVDDGSTDATADEARAAGAVVISYRPNRGKGVALNLGYDYAVREGCDAVITLDGDGQHDPAEMPRFLEAAATDDVHLVLGNRMSDVSTMPRHRRFTNRTTSFFVSWLSGQTMHDSQTGYRLIKAEVLKAVRCTTRNYEAESEILIKAGRAGFHITEVPIATIYHGGKSSIHPLKDTLRFVRLVLRNL
ncbi:MAG TPA: glycosyltransferase family 2 protein [Planctomycetota bacterium]|nr:glycosyltransferase family 2 protein [Planctomycetota bacterium]